MMQIKTWSGLEKALQQATENAMKYTGEQIKKILHGNVQHLWYNARSEEYQYSRTYEVLNSIALESIKNGKNGYIARIYFDESKISPQITENGFFNKHMSLDGNTSYGGKSISLWVVEWMESGQRSPIYSYNGAGFVSETYQVAKDDAVYLIEESLKKAGFSTVVLG